MDSVDKNCSDETESNLFLSPRTKKHEFKLDYRKLEEDLWRELESDKRYWLQNDAKIRAVNNVGTYEDFRQIVLAAHLRPLDKKDRDELGPVAAMKSQVVWNNVANNKPTIEGKSHGEGKMGAERTKLGSHSVNSKAMTLRKAKPNRNWNEGFTNDWKNLESDNEKFTFLEELLSPSDWKSSNLKSLKSSPLKCILSNEVPIEIFPNILEVLEKKLQENAGTNNGFTVLRILQIVAESKRFGFTQIFLTSEDRNVLTNIFSVIKNQVMSSKMDAVEHEEPVGGLRNLFNTVKALYSNLTG